MDDSFRTSDADRDRVAALLRDHFAEGRLTPEELDERLTATLNAKTFGDLRRVLADLPGPAPVPLQAERARPQAAPVWITARRRPRLLPLAALALIAALLIPGPAGFSWRSSRLSCCCGWRPAWLVSSWRPGSTAGCAAAGGPAIAITTVGAGRAAPRTTSTATGGRDRGLSARAHGKPGARKAGRTESRAHGNRPVADRQP